jgi:hypothetical protein
MKCHVLMITIFLAAGSISGCGDDPLRTGIRTDDTRPAPPDGGLDERDLQVVGTLTGEGVECVALRTDGGDLYTLIGDLRDFVPGDRVRVTGSPVEVSFCQQGTTLEVTLIEAA